MVGNLISGHWLIHRCAGALSSAFATLRWRFTFWTSYAHDLHLSDSPSSSGFQQLSHVNPKSKEGRIFMKDKALGKWVMATRLISLRCSSSDSFSFVNRTCTPPFLLSETSKTIVIQPLSNYIYRTEQLLPEPELYSLNTIKLYTASPNTPLLTLHELRINLEAPPYTPFSCTLLDLLLVVVGY